MIRFGNPELPNLYNFPTHTQAGLNFDTTGKKRMYPTIGGTTGIFVTLGQSKIANNSAGTRTLYTPAATVLNLNPYDGHYYIASDPVLGCTTSAVAPHTGWHGRLGDKLRAATAKYDQVVFIPIALSGPSVTGWKSDGVGAAHITAVCAMLTAKSLTPTAWLWQQGTTDALAGMSQGDYTTHLRAVCSFIRGHSGRSSDKIMIAKDTLTNTGGTANAAVAAAQAAVQGDSNNLAGPDCDSLTNAANYGDTLHYNDVGNDAVAGLWNTAIRAVL